jgi:hypothetical protein
LWCASTSDASGAEVWLQNTSCRWTTYSPALSLPTTHAVDNRSLPSDPEALRALAIALREALATKDRELAARDVEICAQPTRFPYFVSGKAYAIRASPGGVIMK